MSTAKTPDPQSELNVSATEESSPIEKKTPNKRTRLSFIERAQKESEELVKNMGGSLELEGGRRTRSSTRGTPSRPAVVTPPPTKKARNSPASPKTTPKARGRGRKLDTAETPEPTEQTPSKEPALEKEEPVEESKETAKENSTPEVQSTKDAETNGPENLEDVAANDTTSAVKPVSQSETEAPEPEQLSTVGEDSNQVADQVDSVQAKVEEKTEEKKSYVVPESKATKTAPTSVTEECTKKELTPEPESAPVATATTTKSAEVADSPMDVDEQPEEQESNLVIAQNSTEKVRPDSTTVVADSSTPAIEKEVIQTELETTKTPVVVPVAIETPPIETSPVPESVPVAKQPTPEPMEVDSSSKSSDIVECTDVVDKAALNSSSQPTENTNSKTITATAEQVSKESSLSTAVDSLTQNNAEKNSTTVAAAPNNDKAVVEEAVKEIPSVPVTTDIKSLDATEVNKIDAVSENKTENNIIEPKLLAPALNAAADVAAAVTTS